MYYVYIIENLRKKIYIGYTDDIDKRLVRHNRTEGSLWTQGKGPWKLIYTEDFISKSEAMKRERKLKSLKVGQRIKCILNITNVPL